jgi:putative dehydrogenase
MAIGDMGRGVAVRLREGGARVITCLTGRGEGSAARARSAGVEMVADDEAMVREAEAVLSIVPPGAALELARRIAVTMVQSGARPAYIDCNAISAATMRGVGEVIAGAGGQASDVGIIGGPPDKARGTKFYASGPRSAALDRLAELGLNVRWIGGEIGQASALKMAYGGFTKGVQALGAALMISARRAGVAEVLEAELADSQAALLAMLDRSLPSMPAKAYRWVAEMEEGAASLSQAGLPPGFLEAAARLYAAIAATPTAKDAPIGGRVAGSRAELMDALARELGAEGEMRSGDGV